jgi:DNA ligase (NAD+)
MPRACPVCGSAAVRLEGEAATRCINSSCLAQLKERIKHFASKGAFDIDGLGDKLVDQLVEKGLVSSYADLFDLDVQTVAALDRMGTKSAENLIDAIESGRQIVFARFLYALGIRHVGEYVAGLLADQFDSLELLMDCPAEDLTDIEGVGPIVAKSIVGFFKNNENLTVIQRLLDSGVKIEFETKLKTDFLDAKVFVLTGTLQSMTRRQAREMIEAAGGKVTGSVSRNTDYIVAGQSPGSKLAKAQELGVQVIDEAALLEILGSQR